MVEIEHDLQDMFCLTCIRLILIRRWPARAQVWVWPAYGRVWPVHGWAWSANGL